MTPELIVNLALFAAAVLFIGWPLFGAAAANLAGWQLQNKGNDLNLKKQTLMTNMKELEFDHELKKISDEDFKKIAEENYHEGAQILAEIDKLEKKS